MSTTHLSPDADTLAGTIAERLVERLENLQRAGRTPSVVLTGGTIAVKAYERVVAGDVDWTAVDFYWGDERYVAAGHDDRNDRQAQEAFLTRLGVPLERQHVMPADDEGLPSIGAAADAHAAVLPDEPFDLVLHGVGPDGHIASLFPGFPQLHETERRVVDVSDSPKPPSRRISLTLPTLNHADAVWLLVSGEGKAEAVARALGDGTLDDTPASAARGLTETVWFLDDAAASHLPH
jgi:6-phosphogluconolactonase